MKQYNWFKVCIEPRSPPQCMLNFCKSTFFFVRISRAENNEILCSSADVRSNSEKCIQKALKRIKDVCATNLLDSFCSQDKCKYKANEMEFKDFLTRNGFHTNIEDDTFDDIIDTALLERYQDMYNIISIEQTSNCEACRLEEPGQRAHMITGGCLYQSDE